MNIYGIEITSWAFYLSGSWQSGNKPQKPLRISEWKEWQAQGWKAMFRPVQELPWQQKTAPVSETVWNWVYPGNKQFPTQNRKPMRNIYQARYFLNCKRNNWSKNSQPFPMQNIRMPFSYWIYIIGCKNRDF